MLVAMTGLFNGKPRVIPAKESSSEEDRCHVKEEDLEAFRKAIQASLDEYSNLGYQGYL